ncbi:MAG TPA: hypothetical protein DCZ95_18925 [Verrucomicrobia bacterium]|nr:MAG: hypothetical protein A2X46_17165 [Lentisphaerae bacterium GWF2_57_35]HBA86161.1 hypothetical protein [Verrucomicrobiota bacterium]
MRKAYEIATVIGLSLGLVGSAASFGEKTNAIDKVEKSDKTVKTEKSVQGAKLAKTAPASKFELKVDGDYLFPGEDFYFDKAYGASAKLIYWLHKNFGLALAAGVQKWDAKDELRVDPAEDWGSGFAFIYGEKYSGDAKMFPLGGSVVAKFELAKKLNLSLEGGLRYVMISSDVSLETMGALVDTWYDNEIVDSVKLDYDVDMDNGFIGLLAADLDYEIVRNTSLFVGGGYQIDISKSTPTITLRNGENVDLEEDNALKGFFVRAGAAYLF